MAVLTDKVIRDREFTSFQQLADMTDVLIERCSFTGIFPDEGALKIRNCHNVEIRGCRFYGLTTSAIVVQSTTPSTNINIHNNDFWDIKGNGIITKFPNSGVRISYNRLWEVGADDKAHPLYIMTPGTIAEYNHIFGTTGDGITIRTEGIVRGNEIWNARKAAIRYFSDGHPRESSELIIEENFCYGSGAGYPVISLLYGLGTMLERYLVSRNRIISTNATSPAFQVQSSQFAGKEIFLNDNIAWGELKKTYVTKHWGNVEN